MRVKALAVGKTEVYFMRLILVSSKDWSEVVGKSCRTLKVMDIVVGQVTADRACGNSPS